MFENSSIKFSTDCWLCQPLVPCLTYCVFENALVKFTTDHWLFRPLVPCLTLRPWLKHELMLNHQIHHHCQWLSHLRDPHIPVHRQEVLHPTKDILHLKPKPL